MASIDFVFPSSMVDNTTEQVLIQGSGLGDVTDVYFGNVSGTNVRVNADGTQVTTTVSGASRTVGVVDVRLMDDDDEVAKAPGGFEFLPYVKGYRAFYKWADNGATWSKALTKDADNPKATSITLDIARSDHHVWKVTVLPLMSDGSVLGVPAGQKYPADGDKGLEVAWATGSVVMPTNLTWISSPGSFTSGATLSWSPAVSADPSAYPITGYRVFYKRTGSSEWNHGFYNDVSASTTEFEFPWEAFEQITEKVCTVLPLSNGTLIGAGQDPNWPWPDDGSNRVVTFGQPQLLVQAPAPYGQVFVPAGSVGAVSIFAGFEYMGKDDKYEWRWDKSADGNYKRNNFQSWSEFDGRYTSTLTFGVGGHPISEPNYLGLDKGDGGWYVVSAWNGALKPDTGTGDLGPDDSKPVHVWIGSPKMPALISQAPTVGQTVYVQEGTIGKVYLQALYNRAPTADTSYVWQWNKDKIGGSYKHGGGWGHIDGDYTRALSFGYRTSGGTERGADTRDSGYYRVQVKANGYTVWSDPVLVVIGEAYYGPLTIATQWPNGGETVLVPMTNMDDNSRVSISAYPRFPNDNEKATLTWEWSPDARNWSTVNFPTYKDVYGMNSTTLWFTPNGSTNDYGKKVNGWYRLRVDQGSRKSVYSDPVQVTVVDSAIPELLNQDAGPINVKVATNSGPSFGAYFSYMDGVPNGYVWEYSATQNGTFGAFPTTDGIAGIGTPTLTIGIPGSGASVKSSGWYRLIATNQYGSSKASTPIQVTVA